MSSRSSESVVRQDTVEGRADDGAAEVAVALEGVVVRYGRRTALQADLRIPAGQKVALVGPSGAGKSTLLRLCNGTRQPAEGTVRVLGEDLQSLSGRRLRRLRSRIGTVHQSLDLVGPSSVLQNVTAGALGRWSTPRALISRVRPLEADAARAALAALGIAHLERERTERLSGGEQQRVALARILVQDPAVLLADEPVASLDPARAEAVLEMLTDIAAERTLLVSLHDAQAARRWCDRVLGLREGRVVLDAPAADVRDEDLAALYRLEA